MCRDYGFGTHIREAYQVIKQMFCKREKETKTHLGGGVYAEFKADVLVLTTEDATIFIEPEVWQALYAYVWARLPLVKEE